MPVLFLLNKGDSPVALGNEAVLEALELGNSSGGRRRWAMLRASAATGEGLPEATRWLMENANPGREKKEPEREAERAFALLASGASRVVRVRC